MPTASPSFDVAGAQKAGYSDDEILQHLKSSGSFDVDGAMKAGYKPAEILAHFQSPTQSATPPEVNKAIAGVPRPAAPQMNRVGLVFGDQKGPETPVMNDIDSALKGTVQNAYQTSTPGIATSIAQKLAPGVAAALPPAMQQNATPLKQLPAQVAANYFMMGAMPGEEPAGIGSQPPAPPPDLTSAADAINARQAASGVRMTAPPTPHDEALFKASRDFHDAASTYDQKVSQNFDLSKRDQLEAQQQHQADLLKAKADYDTAVQKHEAARTDWQAKTDAAQASQEQAAQVAARKQQITETLPSLAEEVRNRTQQIYQEGRGQLNDQWDAIRSGVGSETPTPISGVVDALNKAESTYLRGSPQSLTRFRQLVNELGIGDMVGEKLDEAGGAEATQLPAGRFYQLGDIESAPWQTVRTHSANIGRAMAGGDLGNVYPAMKLVRNALEDAAGQVAAERGYGEAYQATRAREAQFRKDFEDLGPVSTGKGNPAARLVRAPNATFASDIIHGKATDLLEQALGRWDQSGDLATTLQQMRDLKSELGSLPKVKVLPTPPPFTTEAPTLQTPAAPSGLGPERTMPQSPDYPQVAPPKPSSATASPTVRQRIIQEAARVAGKVAGGAAGSAVGHPLIGYGIGGEAGSHLGKALTREGVSKGPPLPPLPTTPEQYTRTILAAKDGELSPGEAARRIARGGGSNAVKPLPPPT